MKNTIMEKGFPENLFSTITGYEAKDVKLPKDFTASMMYLIYTLPERSAGLVLARYRDGLSLRDVGEKFGISGARAEMLINDSISLMKAKSNLLTDGVENTLTMRGILFRNEIVSEIEKKYKSQYTREGYQSGYLDGLKKRRQVTYSYGKYDTMTIADISLSNRSYNALTGANLITISDIIHKGNALHNLRNIGASSLQEIIGQLKEIGVDVHKYFPRIIYEYNLSF